MTVALGLLPIAAAPVSASRTAVIGNALYIEAGGCQSVARDFDIAIPDYEHLDSSLPGIIAGIQLSETTRVGRSGFRNVSFGNGTLHVELFAEGGGTIEHVPWPIDRDICVNPSGGSIGVSVTAAYRP